MYWRYCPQALESCHILLLLLVLILLCPAISVTSATTGATAQNCLKLAQFVGALLEYASLVVKPHQDLDMNRIKLIANSKNFVACIMLHQSE